MATGINLTRIYYYKAIKLNKVLHQGYVMMIANEDNPRLMDAGMILSQGNVEMEIEEQEMQGKLVSIDGGKDD